MALWCVQDGRLHVVETDDRFHLPMDESFTLERFEENK
jgi:hypothetical protein